MAFRTAQSRPLLIPGHYQTRDPLQTAETVARIITEDGFVGWMWVTPQCSVSSHATNQNALGSLWTSSAELLDHCGLAPPDRASQRVCPPLYALAQLHAKRRITGQPELVPLESKFLVERFRVRFATEEILEGLHLFLASPTFQHSMAISPPFLAIHRILLEIRVEQVAAENLGAETWVRKHAIIEPSHHETNTFDRRFN